MRGHLHRWEGTLLFRAPHGETHLKLELYSAEAGLKVILMRTPSARGKCQGEVPDLFDEAIIEAVEKAGGGAPFLREYRTISRRMEVATSPGGFLAACELAGWLRRNAPHLPDHASAHHTLGQALQAWQRGGAPKTVLLKALYLFAREEGFPVKEDWFPSLGLPFRNTIAQLLRDSAPKQSHDAEGVAEALASLENWLVKETPLLRPE